MILIFSDDGRIAGMAESYQGSQKTMIAPEGFDFNFANNFRLIDGELVELTPESITPRQARLKLLEIGLLDELEAIITTNRAWQIEWEYATEVKRDSPLIDAVASQAGLTSEQVDQMFIEASKL